MVEPPPLPRLTPTKHTRDVIALVTRQFSDYPGRAGDFWWPVTRDASLAWLDDFVVRRLVDFLPLNNREKPPVRPFFDEPGRVESSLDTLVPENPNSPYDMKELILKIADEGDFFEIQEAYAKNIVVGFARMEGHTVGIVANQPMVLAGVLDAVNDPIDGTNLMYALHFYSCTHTDDLRDDARSAHNRGLPIFVTEWGATNADGGVTGDLCLDEAQRWHDLMNELRISWAAWKLDACSDSSCILPGGAPAAAQLHLSHHITQGTAHRCPNWHYPINIPLVARSSSDRASPPQATRLSL